MIATPFGMIISFFYNLTGSYALTLLFFTVVVQIVLLPLGIKQQKSQIKMAKIRPKEQIIRKKYSGRTDTATQQKINHEVLEMYKRENYSPMSGCLPMLIQLPIIFALFSIVRRPLTYIAGFSAELIGKISEFIESAGDAVISNADPEIQIVRAFEGNLAGFEGNLDTVKNALAGAEKFVDMPAQEALLMGYENMDFGFFGQSLLTAPSEALFSPLIIIIILNAAAVFLQTRLTRKMQAKTALGAASNNKSMKIMEYTFPIMIIYFTYIMNAALGLYWIYRSIAAILQTLVLARVYPIPDISEEELKLAEQQYGGVKKKKKKKKPVVVEEDDEDEEEIEEEAEEIEEEIIEEEQAAKPERKSEIKSNYQKTGKKYTVKRRKDK